MHELVAVAALERRVLELVGPVVGEMGFELVRLRFQGGKNKSLQIMAERTGGGIELEECAEISRAVSAVLDVKDPIRGSYVLEVSSPGVDRPLTRIFDFERWAGHLAKIETQDPVDGHRHHRGVLQGVAGSEILIEADGETRKLDFGALSSARLVLTDALLEATATEFNFASEEVGDEFP